MSTTEEERRQDAIAFYHRNPRVWPLFKRFTFELIKRGFKHHSVRSVWHRIRWETPAGDDGELGFKMGDHHAKFFGRRFMKMYPEYEGFFRKRNTDKIKAELAK